MANFDKVILNGTTYTIPSGGGGTVDEQLSPTSTNAVQNKAIYDETHFVEKFDITHYGYLCESSQSFNDREFKIGINAEDIAGFQYIYYFLPVDGVNVQPIDENGQFIQVRVNIQDTTDIEWWDRTEDNFYAQNVVCTVSKENYYITLHVVPTPISGHTNFLNGLFCFSFTSNRYNEKDNKILMLDSNCHSIDIYKEKAQPTILSVRETVEKLKDKTIYVPTGGISTGDNFVSMSFDEKNLYDGSSYTTHDIQCLYFDGEYFAYDTSKGLLLKYHFFGDGQVTETLDDFESGTSLSEDYTVNTTGLKIYLKQKEINSSCSIYFNADDSKYIQLTLYFDENYTELTLNNNYGSGYFRFDRSEDVLTVYLLNCVMYGNENETFENINVNYHDNFGVHVDKIEWYANCLVETIPEKINRLETDKQDKLVSGTNIKTINNESILGSGNITIQGGGASYTAGDGIDITNDVISVDIDDEKKVIASALTELHNDKADKQQLNNYQLKGDYQTGAQVDAKIATATSGFRSEAEAINVEKVDAAALTDLNARVSDLEQGGGGSGITGITMNGSAVTVTSGVANLGTVVTDKSDKQDTLVSGTNIKTINNESILGSGNITIQGGGTTYTAGTNMEIVSSGGTDTINCTLPIKAGTNGGVIIGDNECTSTGQYSISFGHNADNSGPYSLCIGNNASNTGSTSLVVGNVYSGGSYNLIVGSRSQPSTNPYSKIHTCVIGFNLNSNNNYQANFGEYNISNYASNTFGDAGNTLFTVGNGYDFQSTHNRHNAFEIRQNGDIYIPDTDDTTDTSSTGYSTKPMLRLQDYIATIRSLVTRVTALETALGNISSSLDTINGETV